jgi:hypothetical protein
MSESGIPMSNTPIFDRLAAERGYYNLIDDNPIGNPFGPQTPTQGLLEPGAWIAKAVPVMEPEQITFSENIDPERAEDEHGSFHQYMDDVVSDFYKAHPGAENATLTSTSELDGTFTIGITAIRRNNWIDAAVSVAAELKDMMSVPFEVKRPEFASNGAGIRLKKRPEHYSSGLSNFVVEATEDFRHDNPTAIITAITPHGNDDGTMGMTFEAIEPEIGRHQVKDLAGQQLELYRQAASERHISLPRDISEEDWGKVQEGKFSINDIRRKYLGDSSVSSPTISTSEQTDKPASNG